MISSLGAALEEAIGSMQESFNPNVDALKQFAGQVFVIKFGGNAIGKPEVLRSLIADTATLVKAGVRVVLVHGGGMAVSEAINAIGKETKKIKGLRVTDLETLGIAVRIFTAINKKLAEDFRKNDIQAISAFPPASNICFCKKMLVDDDSGNPADLGWVGEVTGIDTSLLKGWLESGQLPVVAPLGVDLEGHLYNLNADHVALDLARHLQAASLIFLTDVPGVLRSVANPDSRIAELTLSTAKELIDDGTISGGMLPKIQSCLQALENGVKQIAILNSFDSHALVKSLVSPYQTGTWITK